MDETLSTELKLRNALAELERIRDRAIEASVAGTFAGLQRERDALTETVKFLRAECNDFDNKCHALTAENARLKEELGILKTENANKCEELAEALGEVGIDVSNTYDFTDLVQQIGCL